MPRYIGKLNEMYFEWSTIVDAPVTYALTLEEFQTYYKEEYGDQGIRSLNDRLQRVDAKGTSSRLHDSVNDMISNNRAGPDETCLDQEALIKFLKSRESQNE